MAKIEAQSTNDLDYAGNVNYWADRWAQDKTGWHRSDVSRKLIANLPKLCDGGVSKTFFIPLCGKTVDIPYLYAQGHKVFGVEAVAKAIEELNEEHSLGLKFDSESSTYATDDGRVTIYCGDIFACPMDRFGPFDCVWDRASFIAFEYPFRPAYKEMMQRSLKVKEPGATEECMKLCRFHFYALITNCKVLFADHNFKYLLETLDYNREKYPGPPRATDTNDMELFFGDWANIEVISREPDTIKAKPDIGTVEMVHYFLTPKNQ